MHTSHMAGENLRQTLKQLFRQRHDRLSDRTMTLRFFPRARKKSLRTFVHLYNCRRKKTKRSVIDACKSPQKV